MKYICLIIILLSTCMGIFSQQLPTLVQLEYAKQNKSKIENGVVAYDALKRDADKRMNKTLRSVVEKNIVAVSGNRHDYVSMGPYWWPDPSKPEGLPYIRKDGQRNPEVQNLDRYKLDDLVKNVCALSYAFYFSEEEKYADQAVKNLRMWFVDERTKMNPNLEYGQMIPGRNGGKGRAEGIIDTYCFVELTNCINLLSPSKSLTEKDSDAIRQWFSDYLDWLITSDIGKDECSAKNNHGLAYDVQITAYALFTERNNIARKTINEFAEKRLFTQIEPDGSQPLELARTIALHYSIFNIEHALDMCFLAQSYNIDLFRSTSLDGRSLTKAIEFVKIYLGMPQSDFPYDQIKEWDLNQEKLCWMLRRSTFLQPNAEYDKLFDKYCKTKETDIRWLFYAK